MMNLKFNFLNPNKNKGKLKQTSSMAICALGATADMNIESPDIPPYSKRLQKKNYTHSINKTSYYKHQNINWRNSSFFFVHTK